jgi:hypothetical protein
VFSFFLSQFDSTGMVAAQMSYFTYTLYLVSTGTAVVPLGLRSQIDTHWHRGLSYFQIGWRWIHQTLAHLEYLLPFFLLELGPDPLPVSASKRQAAKPIASLFVLRLEITWDLPVNKLLKPTSGSLGMIATITTKDNNPVPVVIFPSQGRLLPQVGVPTFACNGDKQNKRPTSFR